METEAGGRLSNDSWEELTSKVGLPWSNHSWCCLHFSRLIVGKAWPMLMFGMAMISDDIMAMFIVMGTNPTSAGLPLPP